MSDSDNSVGDRRFSAAFPFGSLSFALVGMLGLGSIVINVYLIYRYWHTAPGYVAPILSDSLHGLQWSR
ncbi:MAG TPA: hypothetical protein VGK24_15755 [Candidatus Angelobacter sp.]|jgi:hypothetical protein